MPFFQIMQPILRNSKNRFLSTSHFGTFRYNQLPRNNSGTGFDRENYKKTKKTMFASKEDSGESPESLRCMNVS